MEGTPKLSDTDCVCPASSCHGTACHPGTPPPLLADRGSPRSPGLLHRPLPFTAGDPARCLACRVRGPSHAPSPAQGWPRNARRTSSGARTGAASPLCGDATRTMTARTTATRTTAVSGRWGRERRWGTPCLARTWLSCRPATCVDLTPQPGSRRAPPPSGRCAEPSGWELGSGRALLGSGRSPGRRGPGGGHATPGG